MEGVEGDDLRRIEHLAVAALVLSLAAGLVFLLFLYGDYEAMAPIRLILPCAPLAQTLSLILAIAALLRIRRAPARLTGSGLAWTAIGLSVAPAVWTLFFLGSLRSP